MSSCPVCFVHGVPAVLPSPSRAAPASIAHAAAAARAHRPPPHRPGAPEPRHLLSGPGCGRNLRRWAVSSPNHFPTFSSDAYLPFSTVVHASLMVKYCTVFALQSSRHFYSTIRTMCTAPSSRMSSSCCMSGACSAGAVRHHPRGHGLVGTVLRRRFPPVQEAPCAGGATHPAPHLQRSRDCHHQRGHLFLLLINYPWEYP